MKFITTIILIILVFTYTVGSSQSPLAASNGHLAASFVARPKPVKQKAAVVRMTGVRFAYPLIEHWIDRYSQVNPDVQVIIEWRGSQDPLQYDILVEAYEHPNEIKEQREYVNIARYAILPVANAKSDFARNYSVKGFTKETIKEVFFHDIFADAEKRQEIKSPYTTYTRLQKAGAPLVFARYFGYDQKDIKGKGIAGSDEHLLKAVLRDSLGVSYLPLSLIYERTTRKAVSGLSVLPVDFDGNDRVSDDEKFYGELANVVKHLSGTNQKDINNIPIEYLHLSVDKANVSIEAIAFIRWVIDHGLADLEGFGFLNPEPARLQKEQFEEFISKHFANAKP